jgi:hypothetical protein
MRQNTIRSRKQIQLGFPPSFWLDLFFDPEDGGNIFLRNSGFSTNHTVLQPSRPFKVSAMEISDPKLNSGLSLVPMLQTQIEIVTKT